MQASKGGEERDGGEGLKEGGRGARRGLGSGEEMEEAKRKGDGRSWHILILDKYTTFSTRAKGYRKGVHLVPKWTRVSTRDWKTKEIKRANRSCRSEPTQKVSRLLRLFSADSSFFAYHAALHVFYLAHDEFTDLGYMNRLASTWQLKESHGSRIVGRTSKSHRPRLLTHFLSTPADRTPQTHSYQIIHNPTPHPTPHLIPDHP